MKGKNVILFHSINMIRWLGLFSIHYFKNTKTSCLYGPPHVCPYILLWFQNINSLSLNFGTLLKCIMNATLWHYFFIKRIVTFIMLFSNKFHTFIINAVCSVHHAPAPFQCVNLCAMLCLTLPGLYPNWRFHLFAQNYASFGLLSAKNVIFLRCSSCTTAKVIRSICKAQR